MKFRTLSYLFLLLVGIQKNAFAIIADTSDCTKGFDSEFKSADWFTGPSSKDDKLVWNQKNTLGQIGEFLSQNWSVYKEASNSSLDATILNGSWAFQSSLCAFPKVFSTEGAWNEKLGGLSFFMASAFLDAQTGGGYTMLLQTLKLGPYGQKKPPEADMLEKMIQHLLSQMQTIVESSFTQQNIIELNEQFRFVIESYGEVVDKLVDHCQSDINGARCAGHITKVHLTYSETLKLLNDFLLSDVDSNIGLDLNESQRKILMKNRWVFAPLFIEATRIRLTLHSRLIELGEYKKTSQPLNAAPYDYSGTLLDMVQQFLSNGLFEKHCWPIEDRRTDCESSLISSTPRKAIESAFGMSIESLNKLVMRLAKLQGKQGKELYDMRLCNIFDNYLSSFQFGSNTRGYPDNSGLEFIELNNCPRASEVSTLAEEIRYTESTEGIAHKSNDMEEAKLEIVDRGLKRLYKKQNLNFSQSIHIQHIKDVLDLIESGNWEGFDHYYENSLKVDPALIVVTAIIPVLLL